MTVIGAESRAGGLKVSHVIQGEYRVSDDPGIVLTTILGSCVATCLCDPVARVGGINHFLLPDGNGGDGLGFRYGLLAMELLINGLLKSGADKARLQAKLFGGARMNNSLVRIGDANAAFAREFLKAEGIRCQSESLGGTLARRIRYVPTTGAAQQMMLSDQDDPVPSQRRTRPAASDDVTLF
mgnify:CR=1 FL=1